MYVTIAHSLPWCTYIYTRVWPTHACTHAFHRRHGAPPSKRHARLRAGTSAAEKTRRPAPSITEKDAHSLACLYVHVFSLKIAGMVTAQGGTSTIVAKEIRSCADFLATDLFFLFFSFLFLFFFFLERYFERFFFLSPLEILLGT